MFYVIYRMYSKSVLSKMLWDKVKRTDCLKRRKTGMFFIAGYRKGFSHHQKICGGVEKE